jgi:hypothetical protein
MKLLTGSHRALHHETSERSLCADIAVGNCANGHCTVRERRNGQSRKGLAVASLLIQRAYPHTRRRTSRPFGLARKSPP